MWEKHWAARIVFIFVIAVEAMVPAGSPDDVDKIEKKLNTAREAYTKNHKAVHADVLKQIEQREAVERKRKSPNLKAIEVLKTERERLEKHDELPIWIDLARKKRIVAANNTFLESLKAAKAVYVKSGNDPAAAMVDEEIKRVEIAIREYRTRFDTATFIREGLAYQFINQESGLALDVKEASKASGAQLCQREKSDSLSQRWFLRTANNQYQIVNQNSGHLINVAFGSRTSGQGLIQYENQGGKRNELWTISQTGKGFVFISSNKLSIAVPEGVKRDGSDVVQTTTKGKDNEVWLLIPVE